MKQLKLYLLLLLTAISILIPAQEKYVGLDIGYGKTEFDEKKDFEFVLPNSSELINYTRIGFKMYYTPKQALFNINGGLAYDIKKHEESKLNYLRIPVGLDFNIGHKFQVILGAGFYLSYLFAEKNIDYINFYKSLNRSQIGIQINLGFGYCISPDLKIILAYQNHIDLIHQYKKKYYYQKGYDRFIKLGVLYSLKN